MRNQGGRAVPRRPRGWRALGCLPAVGLSPPGIVCTRGVNEFHPGAPRFLRAVRLQGHVLSQPVLREPFSPEPFQS